ncbi:MAG: helix-turn-helix domain-containing protein [Flavobacterium sp.]
MHLKYYLFLFIIIFYQKNFSQNSKYDSIFSKTAQDLLSSDPKKALSNTDYLYKISDNNSERIKASMLKATILRQYGLRNEAISSLKRADSLADTTKDYNLLARINGFLSTLYRENEIYSLGTVHLQKAVAVSQKIEDKNLMYKFLGNLSQEVAYYHMYSFQYSKAIKSLKSGNKLFEKAGKSIDKNFQIAVNDELIAKNYLSLQKADSALVTYNKAQMELEASQSPNSPLKGFLFNGLANVYASLGNLSMATLYYKKAEEIAKASNFFTLKQEVYNSLLQFYKKTDNKKYILYNEMNLKLNKEEEHNRKIIADDLIKTLRKKQLDSKSNYQKSTYLLLGCCIFVILITAGIYIYKRNQDHKKFKIYINKVHSDAQPRIVLQKEASKQFMSETTEKEILKSVKEFEKSDLFLNKEISLNVAAGILNTNHRYLSYVINKHKSKDFGSYINELRINYIVDRLKSDPSYLKYKISYLADQAGFLSHSRFTTAFKKVTGVSPLNFITYLQKEQEGKFKN